ncbi:glycosyltransferase family 2 protein [Ochrobactrum pecoris]|nr:glycosyltransferase family 2 protein [Brucella pecoris]
MIDRYDATKKPVGIVEGRQWPFEHPKEYDPLDLTTPWASGAFCLFDTELYRSIGGMDERFFLYLEDVDVSWRMWLRGASVVYEPRAVTTHFTGGYFYRNDLVENEKFFSIRNFILLSRKFFGEEGEEKALEMLKDFPDKEVVAAAVKDVNENFQSLRHIEGIDLTKAPQIKVTGINQFHEIRS